MVSSSFTPILKNIYAYVKYIYVYVKYLYICLHTHTLPPFKKDLGRPKEIHGCLQYFFDMKWRIYVCVCINKSILYKQV